MTDVNGRSTKSLLEAIEKGGLPLEPLVEGLPVTVEELLDVTRSFDWDTFMALHDNLERMVKNPLEVEAIGARLVLETPLYDFFRRVAGRLITPQQLHFVAQRWLVPAMFPALKIEFEERADGRLYVVNEIPAPLRHSRGFFYIARGAIANVSTLLGLPPTVVDLEISGGRAEFVLTLPPALTVPQRAARVFRAAFGANGLVNELLRQQEELRQSYRLLLRAREDFRQVLERVPTGVAIHGDGTLLWANPALVRLLGYERPRQIVGQPLLSFVHPEDHAVARRHAEPSLDQPAELREYRLVRRDGEILTCEVAPAREVSFEGRTARLMVLVDVSERQRMQRQLLLSARMAALGTLAAGIAHEMNNPLGIMTTRIEVMLLDAEEQHLPPQVLEDLQVLHRAGQRVARIAASLRSFARQSSGDRVPLDLNTIVDEALLLMQKPLGADNVRMHASLDRALSPMLGDANSLHQVLMNLLTNAREAMPDGGEIRIDTGPAERAGWLRLRVADTGPGIPAEAISKIFDPFYTTKRTGTGLGLSVTYGIIHEHGGIVDVRSRAGEGTTFTLEFPTIGAVVK